MHLYRRNSSPFWWAWWTAPDGRRVRRSTRCTDQATARRLVERWIREAEQAFAADRELHIQPIRLAELADLFLETAAAELAPGTVAGYRISIERYILPELGASTLSTAVSRGMVEAWRRRLVLGEISSLGQRSRDDGRLSLSTVNRITSCLRRLYDFAVRHGHMRHNPAAGLPVLKERPEEKYRALSDEEISALIAALERTRRGVDHVRWLRFALATGLRAREIATLRWSQIQALPGSSTGQAILLRAKQTKGARKRIVPLVADAQQQLAEIEADGRRRDGLVFGPADRRTAFARAWEATELDGRIPSAHDLRNTAASRAVAAGFDLAELMEWFGWTNPGTAQRYIHLYGERWADMVRKLESL